MHITIMVYLLVFAGSFSSPCPHDPDSVGSSRSQHLRRLVIAEEKSHVPREEVLVLHVRDALQAHHHPGVPELSIHVNRHLDVEDLHGLAGTERDDVGTMKSIRRSRGD